MIDFNNFIQTGKLIKIDYGPEYPEEVYEVRALVDSSQVVVRSWDDNLWVYGIFGVRFLMTLYENGFLKEA